VPVGAGGAQSAVTAANSVAVMLNVSLILMPLTTQLASVAGFAPATCPG